MMLDRRILDTFAAVPEVRALAGLVNEPPLAFVENAVRFRKARRIVCRATRRIAGRPVSVYDVVPAWALLTARGDQYPLTRVESDAAAEAASGVCLDDLGLPGWRFRLV